MGKIFSFLFLICFTNSLLAQNKVNFTQNGKTTHLSCKPTATYQNINGKINLSITTEDNQLLELNNIDENLFKCGKRIFSKVPKIVLINNSASSPLVSNSAIQISISCKKNSKKVTVAFTGLIKNKTSKIVVSSILNIEQTPKQNIQTN